MTTTLERPRFRSGAGSVLTGQLPQVNLLPPEVRAARSLRATKRWLAISLLVTFVVCIGIFGLALISKASAANELTEAQDDTARLQTEQSKYSQVPQVLGALDQAKSARTLGMSTEVQWKAYMDAVAAVLPPGVNIDSLVVDGATPMAAAATSTNPLQAASVGQIQFTARASTLPDTSAWVDALNSVPGFADAWISGATATEDDHGTYYQVTGTVQLNEAAYSNRFSVTDGEG